MRNSHLFHTNPRPFQDLYCLPYRLLNLRMNAVKKVVGWHSGPQAPHLTGKGVAVVRDRKVDGAGVVWIVARNCLQDNGGVFYCPGHGAHVV